jgi:hypothetical protein
MGIKRININIVAKAKECKDTYNALAISVIIKGIYSSSQVHDYTKDKIAKIVNCSPTTVGRAISAGIKSDICRIDRQSVIFNPITKGLGTIPVKDIPKTLKEVKEFLDMLLVNYKLRQIDFAKHAKLRIPNANNTNSISNKKMRQARCISLGKNNVERGYKHNQNELTYKTLSSIMKCSIPTAVSRVKKFQSKGWLGVEKTKLMPLNKAKLHMRFYSNSDAVVVTFRNKEYIQFSNRYFIIK